MIDTFFEMNLWIFIILLIATLYFYLHEPVHISEIFTYKNKFYMTHILIYIDKNYLSHFENKKKSFLSCTAIFFGPNFQQNLTRNIPRTTLLNKEQELYDYLSRHVIPFFLYMKKHLQVLYLKLICSHYTHKKKNWTDAREAMPYHFSIN